MFPIVTHVRIIRFFQNISLFHRYLITAVVAVLGIFMWALFFYRPLIVHIRNKKTSLKELQKHHSSLQQTMIKLRDERKKKDALRKEVGQYSRDPIFGSNGLTHVLAQARRNGLECKSIKPVENKKAPFYTKEYYLLSFSGLFESVVSFVDGIIHIPMICRIKEIELIRGMEGYVGLFLKVRFVSSLRFLRKEQLVRFNQ
jgi:Tfp pilus assembly protein PilO